MENTPELDGKYLGTITKDFLRISETLKEAAYQIRARKISEYPIFPISKQELSVGALLVSKDELKLNWNIYFSFAEEFVERNLILEDKVEEFQFAFKNPDEFACLFVVDDDFNKFVYIPFPEEG